MMENVEIARRLEEVADLLEAQRANPFRVQSYRRAAMHVRHLTKPLAQVWREEGEEGLRAIAGVGERLATSLRILISTGRLPMLDRLRGETDPVALPFALLTPSVPFTAAARFCSVCAMLPPICTSPALPIGPDWKV